MRGQLLAHARRIWMPPAQLAAAMQRLHFATVPVSRVPGWLPGVLREWTYGQRIMELAISPPPGQTGPTRFIATPRLDWFYGWLNGGQMHDGAVFTPAPATRAGTDCDWVPGAAAGSLAGRVAVVELTRLPAVHIPAPCSYHSMVAAATRAGAAALVLGERPGCWAQRWAGGGELSGRLRAPLAAAALEPPSQPR